jgi:hypothetical protein
MLTGAVAIGIGALDAVLALLAFAFTVSAVVPLRRRDAPPVRLTGAGGCCLNFAIGAAAFIVFPVAALLFYGASMLVAAVRGYAGCELFAVSNWIWRRDDQIACPVFHPVDVAEARAQQRKAVP